jgi:hypothetical protein
LSSLSKSSSSSLASSLASSEPQKTRSNGNGRGSSGGGGGNGGARRTVSRAAVALQSSRARSKGGKGGGGGGGASSDDGSDDDDTDAEQSGKYGSGGKNGSGAQQKILERCRIIQSAMPRVEDYHTRRWDGVKSGAKLTTLRSRVRDAYLNDSDCSACKKQNGKQNDTFIVHCQHCELGYHQTCHPGIESVPQEGGAWFCMHCQDTKEAKSAREEKEIEDSPCVVCSQSTSTADNDMACCDECKDWYHQRCHPDLDIIPTSEWLCTFCRVTIDRASMLFREYQETKSTLEQINDPSDVLHGVTLSVRGTEVRPPVDEAPMSIERCGETLEKVRKLYSAINNWTGMTGGNGNGGAIYGEMTESSMNKIILICMQVQGLGEDSAFFDVGSGLGKPNLHAAVAAKCRLSFGVELEDIRWQLSMVNLNGCINDLTGLGSGVFFASANIMDFHTLEPFTHIFLFDVAFTGDVQEHIAHLFNRSPSAQYLISFRRPRETINDFGYHVRLLARQQVRLTGSGEGHTAYFYEKATGVADDEPFSNFPSTASDKTIERDVRAPVVTDLCNQAFRRHDPRRPLSYIRDAIRKCNKGGADYKSFILKTRGSFDINEWIKSKKFEEWKAGAAQISLIDDDDDDDELSLAVLSADEYKSAPSSPQKRNETQIDFKRAAGGGVRTFAEEQHTQERKNLRIRFYRNAKRDGIVSLMNRHRSSLTTAVAAVEREVERAEQRFESTRQRERRARTEKREQKRARREARYLASISAETDAMLLEPSSSDVSETGSDSERTKGRREAERMKRLALAREQQRLNVAADKVFAASSLQEGVKVPCRCSGCDELKQLNEYHDGKLVPHDHKVIIDERYSMGSVLNSRLCGQFEPLDPFVPTNRRFRRAKLVKDAINALDVSLDKDRVLALVKQRQAAVNKVEMHDKLLVWAENTRKHGRKIPGASSHLHFISSDYDHSGNEGGGKAAASPVKKAATPVKMKKRKRAEPQKTNAQLLAEANAAKKATTIGQLVQCMCDGCDALAYLEEWFDGRLLAREHNVVIDPDWELSTIGNSRLCGTFMSTDASVLMNKRFRYAAGGVRPPIRMAQHFLTREVATFTPDFSLSEEERVAQRAKSEAS